MALTGLPSPSGAQSVLRPAEIQAKVRAARSALNTIAARLDRAEEALSNANAELVRHRSALKRAEQSRRRISAALADQAAELYKSGGGSNMEVLLSTEDPNTLIDRLSYLEQMRSGERTMLEEIRTLRRRGRDENIRLKAALERSRVAELALTRDRTALARNLREYETLLKFLEQAGGRTVLRSSRSASGFACPVAAAAGLSNNWGRPRPSGPHTGIDMPANHGAPVVAVLPGRIVDTPGGGWIGIGVIMRDQIGNEWWYAHLSSRSVRVGERVVPGQVVGRVGCTGRCYGPHLHFEWHPGGGAPRNPYHLLRQAC